MTLDEMLAREAIRKTISMYNSAVDSGQRDKLAEVFTDDVAMTVAGGPDLVGVDVIIAALTDGAQRRGFHEPGNFQRHHMTSAMIDVIGADTATARLYVMVMSEIGLDHSGMYNDRYRRVGDRWLIAQRQASMEWANPQSRFTRWLGDAKPVS